jgi:hypothetical protein
LRSAKLAVALLAGSLFRRLTVNTSPCLTVLGKSSTLAESAAAGGSGGGEGAGSVKGEGEGVGAGVGVGLAEGDGGAAVAVGAAVTVATGEAPIPAGSPSLFWQARRARAVARAAKANIPLELDISRRFYRKSIAECIPPHGSLWRPTTGLI